jgi:ribonuclease P protein component
MLTRSNRFHGHGGVRRAYRLGRPIRSHNATLHVLRNDKVRRTKVAVVVSRKVDKSAVRRNRIRRRIYELVRPELHMFTNPTELVFTVYSVELATMPSQELQKLIHELLAKAKQ